MPVQRMLYRDAMSRLGAAVNVITTGSKGSRHGFTASAVCSVTDEPPTLLVCMNRLSSSRGAFFVGAPLCVNTLAADQQEISASFASGAAMEQRFVGASWATLVTGAPVLEQANAVFDGLVTNILEVGTHSVLFCEVEAVRLGTTAHGLVYFNRRYHGLNPQDHISARPAMTGPLAGDNGHGESIRAAEWTIP
jgi:flavin reductase